MERKINADEEKGKYNELNKPDKLASLPGGNASRDARFDCLPSDSWKQDRKFLDRGEPERSHLSISAHICPTQPVRA